jgi:hypothetical protein
MPPTTPPQRASPDYVDSGTLDLFTALNIATGQVISDLRRSHTAEDLTMFLNKINSEVPTDLEVNVILGNLATHKTPAVHVSKRLLLDGPVSSYADCC